MDWRTSSAIFGQIGPVGLVLALVITAAEYILLLWLAGLPRAGKGTARQLPGATVAFVAGALVLPWAMAWVQVPLQAVTSRFMMAHVATANQGLLVLPAVLLSGIVQEPAKFVAALLGLAAARAGHSAARQVAPDAGVIPAGPVGARDRAVLFGAAAGAGFGFFEAAVVLSAALAAVSPAAGGAGYAAMWAPIVERMFVVLFHTATTGLVVYAWTRGAGRGLAALAAMALVHGLMNHLSVIVLGPVAGWAVAAAFVALVSLGVFVALVRLVRPKAAGADAGGRPAAPEGM